MTDNEKRAHDLTMLYMHEAFKSGLIKVVPDDKYVDYTCFYTDTYSFILERLEQNLM